MATADETWARIHEPLDTVRRDAAAVPWDSCRQRLLDEVDDHHPVVGALVEWLDGMSDSDRIGLLTGDQWDAYVYQFLRENAEGGDDTPAHEDNPTYDEAAWGEYLATNGPRWDGTAESWTAFRDWFGYYATEAGLSSPAEALLTYLDSQAPADRIATFAAYGVTVTQPTARPAAVQPPAADDPSLTSALERGLAEVPGASELSQEDIDEVMAKVREAMRGQEAAS